MTDPNFDYGFNDLYDRLADLDAERADHAELLGETGDDPTVGPDLAGWCDYHHRTYRIDPLWGGECDLCAHGIDNHGHRWHDDHARDRRYHPHDD